MAAAGGGKRLAGDLDRSPYRVRGREQFVSHPFPDRTEDDHEDGHGDWQDQGEDYLGQRRFRRLGSPTIA